MTASGVGRATLRVALAGPPNTGKSTVFNYLTGLSQHVGNWPGKTVERKTGTCQRGDTDFFLVDLPGSYSLTANSLEEEIARDYIIQEQPDVVAVVVDASSLERNLYLVCELLELGVPLVVVLNMMDIADGQATFQMILPMNALMAEVACAIEQMSSQAGLLMMKAMIDEEVEQLAGQRYTHNDHRKAFRWGNEEGSVIFAGRKVALERPRIRSKDGQEMPLRRYQAFQDDRRMQSR